MGGGEREWGRKGWESCGKKKERRLIERGRESEWMEEKWRKGGEMCGKKRYRVEGNTRAHFLITKWRKNRIMKR